MIPLEPVQAWFASGLVLLALLFLLRILWGIGSLLLNLATRADAQGMAVLKREGLLVEREGDR